MCRDAKWEGPKHFIVFLVQHATSKGPKNPSVGGDLRPPVLQCLKRPCAHRAHGTRMRLEEHRGMQSHARPRGRGDHSKHGDVGQQVLVGCDSVWCQMCS